MKANKFGHPIISTISLFCQNKPNTKYGSYTDCESFHSALCCNFPNKIHKFLNPLNESIASWRCEAAAANPPAAPLTQGQNLHTAMRMCVAPSALFAALWIILQSIVFGSSLKVVLALSRSLFFPALICSLLIPVIKRRDGGRTTRSLCIYTPMQHLTYKDFLQQPCLFSTRVEAQNRKSPPRSFLLPRNCACLLALLPMPPWVLIHAHRLLTDFSASAADYYHKSPRAHSSDCWLPTPKNKLLLKVFSFVLAHFFPLRRDDPLFPYFVLFHLFFDIQFYFFVCVSNFIIQVRQSRT